MDYATSRNANYRRYRQMLHALNFLLENRIIYKRDYRLARRKIDHTYSRMKADRLRSRPRGIRPYGRPAKADQDQSPVCHRDGCDNSRAPGQIYCSKLCAPLGFYDQGVQATYLCK